MNPTFTFNRSTQEYVILGLTFSTTVALIPFAIMRIMTQDWVMATLDASSMLTMCIIGTYVFKTRRSEAAGLLLSIVFCTTEIIAIYIKGPNHLVWCFPATVGIYFLTNLNKAIFVNSASIIVILAVIISRGQLAFDQLAMFFVAMVATNIFTIIFAVRSQIQQQQLEELSYEDPVTGTLNRRAFDDFLLQAETYSTHYSMVMFDIDEFKDINDIHGHLIGDDALKRLIKLVQTQLQLEQKLFRVGGKEYVITPINMDAEHTLQFAERLRKMAEHSTMNDAIGLTISLGIAQKRHNEAPKEWFKRANAALQKAKSQGANSTYTLK